MTGFSGEVRRRRNNRFAFLVDTLETTILLLAIALAFTVATSTGANAAIVLGGSATSSPLSATLEETEASGKTQVLRILPRQDVNLFILHCATVFPAAGQPASAQSTNQQTNSAAATTLFSDSSDRQDASRSVTNVTTSIGDAQY